MSLVDTNEPTADALVLFGATGDLAQRKLFPALYELELHGTLDVPVIGVARSSWTDDDFRRHALDAVRRHVNDVDDEVLDRMCRRLDLVQGDYSDPSTWAALRDVLDRHRAGNVVFYMAIPPSMFPVVAQKLADLGLNERGRIVVEKPFGRDLRESAQALNATIGAVFPEHRIFRIDHYLGKEAVEDLLVFRFSNMLLEPVWNRNYVRSIQITMAEDLDVEGRGSFYDSVRTVRDVLQNHLLQVVALLAMDAPAGHDAKFLHDEKGKVMTEMKTIDPADVVRGQYVGYLDEPGVAADSTTETFVAAKLEIDSWRWAGVPWYVRVGKAMKDKVTEAVVELHSPPRLLFDETGDEFRRRNLIRFRFGPREGVTFSLEAKTPGPQLDSQPVNLDVDFASQLGATASAYERLLRDALAGSPRRFARQDVVEQSWRVIQPILDDPSPICTYERGTWGPAEASRIIPDPGGWIEPS